MKTEKIFNHLEKLSYYLCSITLFLFPLSDFLGLGKLNNQEIALTIMSLFVVLKYKYINTKNYTREQLEKGLTQYYKEMKENPKEFDCTISDNYQEDAEATVDYLLKIIDNEN